jgi:hypothetical protein
MPRRRSLSSSLFRIARDVDSAESVERSVERGSATPAARRAKNVVLGRTLGKAGLWRRLWK